jgi:hypothetical protein
VSESVLTNPTDAQAGSGDSDLCHCQILANAVDDKNRVLGCLDALTDQFLQASPAHADDGELGGDEDAVNEDQRDGGED